MITQEERIIRKSQGYDIGFEKDGKKYWINSNTWNEEKEGRLFQEIGLKTFREETGDKNLVVYDPECFEAQFTTLLCYIGSREKDIPQPINMSSAYNMFFGCSSLQSLDLSDWDTSAIKDMHEMFRRCSSLQYLNLANWNISNVKNMYAMFSKCSSLQSLNLANWDISNVKGTSGMFYHCFSLQSKYNTENDKDLLERIIEDNNKKQQVNKVSIF